MASPLKEIVFQIDLIRDPPQGIHLKASLLRTARFLSRSAQFNLFLHPNTNLICLRLPTPCLRLVLARFALGHTVKELVSRGLKSRSGNTTSVTNRDRLRVSRADLVWCGARKLHQTQPTGQYVSSTFLNFPPLPSQSPQIQRFNTSKHPQTHPAQLKFSTLHHTTPIHLEKTPSTHLQTHPPNLKLSGSK